MCGIAGYSLSGSSTVERTLAAQALLAGIAERGADAVGYAYRGAEAEVSVHKQRTGASALLDSIAVPADVTPARALLCLDAARARGGRADARAAAAHARAARGGARARRERQGRLALSLP